MSARSSLRGSVRRSVRASVQEVGAAVRGSLSSYEQGSAASLRQSVVVDGGVPADVLEFERDSRSLYERTRAVSQLIAAKFREATVGGTFGPALMVVMTVGILLTYHFLSKIIFGGRPKEAQPNKFVLIALTRVLSAVLYWTISRLGLPWEDFKRHLCSRKVWLVCLPYAVGLLAVYVTAMMALEFIALSARNAIMQSRLLLDLFLGNFLLGVRVTPQKMAGVLAIIGAVITSMLTVKQSAMSKDPVLGMLIMLVNNAISSSTYAYFPFVLPRYKVPPTVCSFACAVEVFFLCVLGTGVEMARQGRGLEVLGGFQGPDAVLVLAISLTDTCYFFMPLLLPPIVLTLCVTSTIPCGYFLENVYFGMPVEPLTAVAMLTVGLATMSYVVNASLAAGPKQAASGEEEAAEEEGRLSKISDTSDFAWHDGRQGAADSDCTEGSATALPASGGCSPPPEPAGQAWERPAAQLQEAASEPRELEDGGGQPTLLQGQRGLAAQGETPPGEDPKTVNILGGAIERVHLKI